MAVQQTRSICKAFGVRLPSASTDGFTAKMEALIPELLLGFGAGSGLISSKVDADAHGSFRMNGKITGGAWGGNFVNVMEELGESIADHLAKRAGK